jgi:formylglycine-generating enzyme required for sulfatase activity
MIPGWHPLAGGVPDPWASEWGEDRFGPFQCFSVGGVVQRMRWIREGSFWMGSPDEEKGRWKDEGPQHEVELTKGYWLADTPVTQALWTAVMGDNPSRFPGPEHPVEGVSWEDCQRFMERLNVQVPGLGVRFPSEAEWEYACRAGTKTATWVGDLDDQGTKSSVLEKIAWYWGNSGGKTHPVGEKEANPWGLYDMLGNVREWCEDRFGDYPSGKVIDPEGATTGSRRVNRGGSWFSHAWAVRAAFRLAYAPVDRFDSLGFRLARGLAPSQGAEPQNK